MLTGLHHPELFGYIGSFSGGPNDRSELEKVEHAVLNKYRMIWLGCGTEDLNFPPNKALVDWLDRDAHLWPVWLKFLAETAPRLFDRWTSMTGSLIAATASRIATLVCVYAAGLITIA